VLSTLLKLLHCICQSYELHVNVIFPNYNELSFELKLKLINIFMLFPLWLSSIYLKYICLKVFLVVGFMLHSICGVVIMHITCAVRKGVDVVLLSVLLCMLHWLVGFSTVRLVVLLSGLCV
jgi:hypothetical protein